MIVHVHMFATCPHVTHQSILKATSYYSVPVGVTEYCDDCVCVPVFRRMCVRNRTSDLQKIFVHHHNLWPRLGPPLAALQNVMHFRFYG